MQIIPAHYIRVQRMKWLKIVQELKNPLDYNEFNDNCKLYRVGHSFGQQLYTGMVAGLIKVKDKYGLDSLLDAHKLLTFNAGIECDYPEEDISRSRGFGDTLAKAMHKLKGNKLAEAYEKITGKGCGCAKRRNWLNTKFPYEGGVK